jgi:hypothetical protein
MALAAVRALLGSWNILCDGWVVGTKACLALSAMVPTWDVAPLSAIAEGMDPLRTPLFNALRGLLWLMATLICSRWCWFYLLLINQADQSGCF